ncbi:hypothetical protein DSECCO2_373510 [anaerobic digester metagenome]
MSGKLRFHRDCLSVFGRSGIFFRVLRVRRAQGFHCQGRFRQIRRVLRRGNLHCMGRRIGKRLLRAVRHPDGGGALRVPSGGSGCFFLRIPRRCGRRRGLPIQRGLCAASPRPLAKGLGIHGLIEILSGVRHRLRLRGLRSGQTVGGQTVQHGVVHRVKHLPLPREFHRGLGGVNIYVHRRHRQVQFQHTAGEFTLHQLVAISLLQRGGQQLGFDEPPVDKENLHPPGTPAAQRLCHKAGDAYLAAPALHRRQRPGKVPAQRGVNRGVQLSVAGGVERFCPVLDEFKGDFGMAQGQMLHQAVYRRRLRAVFLHELQPGGGIEKQIPDADGGPLRYACRLDLFRNAALQTKGCPGLSQTAAGNSHPADGGNGGQRLAAKTQCSDFSQILGAAQFAGGMAQKGGGQFLRSNAAAVVRHPDEAHSAVLNLHRHGRRSRVHGVFHQLLDHAGRALHHLAGGDQVGHMGIQLLNVGYGHVDNLSKHPESQAKAMVVTCKYRFQIPTKKTPHRDCVQIAQSDCFGILPPY